MNNESAHCHNHQLSLFHNSLNLLSQNLEQKIKNPHLLKHLPPKSIAFLNMLMIFIVNLPVIVVMIDNGSNRTWTLWRRHSCSVFTTTLTCSSCIFSMDTLLSTYNTKNCSHNCFTLRAIHKFLLFILTTCIGKEVWFQIDDIFIWSVTVLKVWL